ncbi:50S ribosomal protein L37ae [Candidatus Woesearchaeota archaeon]|nr:50S ribosomal protein L37ae [Candidatus Woesearchaeota archaeon]
MAEKHEKAVKRFGVRYGRTIKKKLGLIEAQQRKAHQCPYCRYPKVSRKSAGIWHCSKCNATFTSRAYTVTKPAAVKTEQDLEI